jgi:hypothetical protein
MIKAKKEKYKHCNSISMIYIYVLEFIQLTENAMLHY